MSAGVFQLAKYETESDEILRVRVQPETLALTIDATANAEAAGAITVKGLFPLQLGGRRRKPFSARYVSIQFTGAVPTGYKAAGIVKVPIMTKSVYSGISTGDTGTYLSSNVKVVGKSNHQGDL